NRVQIRDVGRVAIEPTGGAGARDTDDERLHAHAVVPAHGRDVDYVGHGAGVAYVRLAVSDEHDGHDVVGVAHLPRESVIDGALQRGARRRCRAWVVRIQRADDGACVLWKRTDFDVGFRVRVRIARREERIAEVSDADVERRVGRYGLHPGVERRLHGVP